MILRMFIGAKISHKVNVKMYRSKIIPALMFSGGLLLSSALITPAAAQKGTVLTPSTAWAINTVEGKESGAGYCALARRFNQNTILTFAQNSTKELSFALDFQRARFSTSQNIDIVLDAGAGEQREFDVTPISNKAFVVRLGRDKAFLNALKKTGYLRAEIDGYVYGFNLEDIDEGRKTLENCIKTSLPEARSAFSSGKAVQQAPSVSATNTMELAELDIRMKSLEEENERVTQNRARLEQNNESLKQAKQALEIDLKSEIDSLKREVSKLERANETLSNELKSIEGDNALKLSDALAKMRDSAHTVTEFESRNAELLSRLSANDKTLETLRADLSTAEQKNKTYTADIDDINADYTAKMDKLRAELAVQTERNLKLQSAATDAQIAQERSKKQMDKDLAAAQNLLREYEEKTKNLSLKLDDKTKNHDVLIAEIADLKTRNKTLQNAADNSEDTYTADIAKLNETLSRLKSENTELSMVLDAQSKSKSDGISIAQAAAKTAQTKLNTLTKTHEDLLSRLNASDEQTVQLAADLDIAQKQNDLLQTKLSDAAKAHKLENDALQADLKTLRAEKIELAASLDNATGEKGAELEKALKNNMTLESKLVETQDMFKDKIAKLEGDLTAEQDKTAQLAKSLELKQSDLAQDTKETSRLLEKLEQDNAALKAQIAHYEQEQTDVDNKMLVNKLNTIEQKHTAQMQDLEAQIEARDMRIADMNNTLKTPMGDASKSDDVVRLEKKLMALNEKNDALQDELVQIKGGMNAPQTKADARARNLALQDNNITVDEARNAQDLLKAQAAEKVAQAKIDKLERDLKTAKQTAELAPKKSKPSFFGRLFGRGKTVADAGVNTVAGTMAAATTAASATIDKTPKTKPLVISSKDIDTIDTAAPISPQNKISTLPESPHMIDLLAPPTIDDTPERVIKTPVVKNKPTSAKVLKKDPKNMPARAYTNTVSDAQKMERATRAEINNAPAATPIKTMPKETVVTVRKPASTPAPAANAAALAYVPPIEDMVITKSPLAPAPPPRIAQMQNQIPKTVTYTPNYDIRPLIVQAGSARKNSNIRRIQTDAPDTKAVYQWDNDNVYGSLEQSALSDAQNFEPRVQAYLEKTQSRCDGEFAVMADGSRQNGTARADSYDVACITPNTSSSASLLFLQKNNTFNVIAHEANMDNMEAAMSLREKLRAIMMGS